VKSSRYYFRANPDGTENNETISIVTFGETIVEKIFTDDKFNELYTYEPQEWVDSFTKDEKRAFEFLISDDLFLESI